MNTMIPWKRGEARNGERQLAPVSQMRWDWDRLFDRLLDDAWESPTRRSQGMVLDLTETDEQIRVRAEVPGIEPENLEINLAGDVLTLSGQKVDEDEDRKGRRVYSERTFGAYQRAVRLPCPIDPDRIVAEHRNGVVTITLEKAVTVRPKRIEVKSA